MTAQALDRLGNGFSELIELLDGDDIERLETVIAEVRVALEDVRAEGAWRDTHEVTGRIQQIMPLVEAARIRVNFLTDLNRQRVDMLARHGGRMTLSTYKR
ncbi:hypothetical protein [Rhizorhapis sp.]|uniref:hypothetical protein n=1 Tax=Rhizorhapis sp. TaxID=1968842 RepID=UPI002B4948F1|nr:hypothetical protein [Rhizorhapis sp.]HKR18101.1 hypothetical protein [Rhizorhapis sp.]